MHHKLTPSATKRLEGLEKLEERIFLSPPHQNGLEEAMVREALESNWLAPAGPHLAAFEQEICAEVGEGFLGAALSSGTAALHLALRVLGVGPGDVVFCSDLTFAGSVHPMLYEHATPVLIDCGADSCNMDPAALEKAFALYRPKAVIVVDLYGQSADWDAILPLCRAHGVPVIEDAAEALGAKYKGRPCGSFGDIGVFSFNGNKIITTSGGGMAVSRRADWIEKIRFLASQAKEPAPYYLHKELGFNYRMSNVCAGIGRAQLRTLGQRIARRKAICEGYTRAFAGLPLHLLPVPQGVTPNYWLSVIILDDDCPATAQTLTDFLESQNIEARRAWNPMHRQPLFSSFCCVVGRPEGKSRSGEFFGRGVCLPSGSGMTDEELAAVAERVRLAL